MKPKTKVLSNAKLNELYNYLCSESGTSLYDENGRPVFSLTFNGTEEQYEEMRKRLIELNPERQTNHEDT